MKNYEKPVVVNANELAEGVYLASGDAATCWVASARSVQDWNGSHNVFEITAEHTTDIVHISNALTIQLTFSSAVTGAYSENDWVCDVAGNVVTVTRPSHANAYNNGDRVSFKVWVTTGDEATTKAISCLSCVPTACDKAVNVQGGMD